MTEMPHDPQADAVTRPPPGAVVAPPAGDGAGAAAGGGFGLPVAVALIMGSIIGVGIFNLPTSMALTTVGAIALALMFAALSRRLPADGGPYAYSRAAFGNVVGFFNAWSYWITAWAGNAGIAVGWVLYVEVFINKGQNKLITVLLVIVGLFYIKSANFTPWNVSGQGAVGAIGAGMAIALFSYLGVEVASVAAGKVRDPDRNVPRSTVLGTLACAVVYLLSLIAVFGIVPNSTLQKSTAPFSDAVNTMFGGTWAGYVMAIVVIISGFGALNGWTMICAEMPLAAAKDGLFPERFKHVSKNGVPVYGIIASTVLASIAMAINYIGSGGAQVFTTLVLMTGITSAIPYAFSALAQIKWRIVDRRTMHGQRFARDTTIAVVALVFSVLFIWYSRNTGASGFQYWAPFVLAGVALLLGIPVYFAQRGKMTEPEPVPEYR